MNTDEKNEALNGYERALQDELIPCPFCGDAASLCLASCEEDGSEYWRATVQCENGVGCRARVSSEWTQAHGSSVGARAAAVADAINRWQRRFR